MHVTIGQQDQYVTIHIIAVTYPSDLYIAYESLIGNYVKSRGNIIAFISPSANARIYETSNQETTATITNVIYTIENSSSGYIHYNKFLDQITTNNWDGTIGVESNLNGGITTTWLSGSFPVDDSIIEYTIKIKVVYASSKTIEVTKRLIVLDDSTALLDSASHSVLYRVFANKIGSVTSNYLYRLDLLSVDGSVSIEEQQNESLTGILTHNEDSVLNYIPNVTSLSIVGCTNLHNVNN